MYQHHLLIFQVRFLLKTFTHFVSVVFESQGCPDSGLDGWVTPAPSIFENFGFLLDEL